MVFSLFMLAILAPIKLVYDIVQKSFQVKNNHISWKLLLLDKYFGGPF